MRHVCTFAVLLWLTSTTLARDVYVNNVGGDDRNVGVVESLSSGADGPVRTIAKGLRLAVAGDRLVIANTSEPYRESVILFGSRHSGSLIAPFIVEGNGSTLDGTDPIPSERWTNVGGELFAFQPRRLGYQRLFAAGQLLGQRPMARSQVGLPPLSPREWCFSGSEVFFRADPGKLPADYDLSCCLKRTGITLSYVEQVVIHDLVVQGYSEDGISAIDLVRGALFDHVTSRANGRSGIAARGATRIVLDDCLLEDNGQSGLRSEDFAHITLVERPDAEGGPIDVDQVGGSVVREAAEEADSGPAQ